MTKKEKYIKILMEHRFDLQYIRDLSEVFPEVNGPSKDDFIKAEIKCIAPTTDLCRFHGITYIINRGDFCKSVEELFIGEELPHKTASNWAYTAAYYWARDVEDGKGQKEDSIEVLEDIVSCAKDFEKILETIGKELKEVSD